MKDDFFRLVLRELSLECKFYEGLWLNIMLEEELWGSVLNSTLFDFFSIVDSLLVFFIIFCFLN